MSLLSCFFNYEYQTMKKRIFLLLFLSVLITNIGISQVAKIKNEILDKDEIILIGPLNVDAYFPEQSNTYILKYEKIVNELNSLIKDFESELEYLENKSIKNKFKVNQINKAIEKFNFELELLNDFILFWEEHDLNFNSCNNDFRENFQSSQCYSYIIGGETYTNSEIEVVEVRSQKEFKYYEFIDGDYLEILKKFAKKEFDKSKHNKKCIIRVKGSPKEFVICADGYMAHTSNVLEEIEKIRKLAAVLNGRRQKQLLDEDDLKVIIRTEHLFSQFRFDKDDKTFYKERAYKVTRPFYQIWLKEVSIR